MKITAAATNLLFFVIMAALLFMIVRPGSPAADGVVIWGEAIAAVVGTATGQTQRGG